MDKDDFFLKSKLFFRNFFRKCKTCIVWNWFMTKIIIISWKFCFFKSIQSSGKIV